MTVTTREKIENVGRAYWWREISPVRYGWTTYQRNEPDRVLQLHVMYSSAGNVRQAEVLRIVGCAVEHVARVGAVTKGKRETVLEWLGKAWEIPAAQRS
jgi:hypothetical protein